MEIFLTSKSKVKGNSAERSICKFLGQELGGTFQRVPNSGAMTGGANRNRKIEDGQRKNFEGDIIPPDHLPKLRIESKFYAEFPFHRLMQQEPIPQLDSWIEQANIPNSIWFLIFKINRKGSYILFPKSMQFIVGNHVAYYDFIITNFEPFITQNKDMITNMCL